MRTRNRHISVWMNEQEYRHLRAQAELAGTFYPMEPPVPTTKPATPIVMESVTVDTFGVDYPAPVTYPAPIKPPAW